MQFKLKSNGQPPRLLRFRGRFRGHRGQNFKIIYRGFLPNAGISSIKKSLPNATFGSGKNSQIAKIRISKIGQK